MSPVDPFGNQRIGLEGKATVNRKDWGITWNAALEAGGVLVSEKVTLEFGVSAIRIADAAWSPSTTLLNGLRLARLPKERYRKKGPLPGPFSW